MILRAYQYNRIKIVVILLIVLVFNAGCDKNRAKLWSIRKMDHIKIVDIYNSRRNLSSEELKNIRPLLEVAEISKSMLEKDEFPMELMEDYLFERNLFSLLSLKIYLSIKNNRLEEAIEYFITRIRLIRKIHLKSDYIAYSYEERDSYINLTMILQTESRDVLQMFRRALRAVRNPYEKFNWSLWLEIRIRTFIKFLKEKKGIVVKYPEKINDKFVQELYKIMLEEDMKDPLYSKAEREELPEDEMYKEPIERGIAGLIDYTIRRRTHDGKYPWAHPEIIHKLILVQNDLLYITAYLREFQILHGKTSHSLNELEEFAEESFPLDPFSQSPYKYIPDEEKIYSIGPDKIDEQGKKKFYNPGDNPFIPVKNSMGGDIFVWDKNGPSFMTTPDKK